MKKLALSLSVLAAVLAIAPAAKADVTPGWYVGAGVGATVPPDAKAKTNGGDTKLQFDTSVNYNINGGYSYGNGWRSELEIYRNQANIDKIEGQATKNGHISNTILFANGFYDFNMHSMFTPYVGIGVGADVVNAENVSPVNGGGRLHGDRTEFAYQGIVGASAQLDDNWAVTADYRYIASYDPQFANAAGGKVATENMSHNFILGVRYSFGQPAPMAPIHTAEAPAMSPLSTASSAVAPVPQSYMVFFDFNKSDLTPEAKRILASAAQEFHKGGFVKIVVTGHTDTVGGVAYNQKLSERRAAVVAAELKRLGVNASAIDKSGRGKNDLMVPTADGVREAQNRRAEIVFNK